MFPNQLTFYFNYRISGDTSDAAVSLQPAAHFGMGINYYATWTSPIRKYGDLVNQRLLKAILAGQQPQPLPQSLTQHLAEQRKTQRKAERDISIDNQNQIISLILTNTPLTEQTPA